MQDWEWEVADVEHFAQFLDAYHSANLNDDELFSLMELLVQCVEVTATSSYQAAWSAIEPLLMQRPGLHRSTVQYWACLGEAEPEALFNVSRDMRRLWSAIR